MIKFVADENFDNRIVRGLQRRMPELDIVRVQDLEIAGADDNTVLAWAAQAERVLLTHDQRTVPKYAYERIRKGETVAGLIVAKDTLPLRSAIESLPPIVKNSRTQELSITLRALFVLWDPSLP